MAKRTQSTTLKSTKRPTTSSRKKMEAATFERPSRSQSQGFFKEFISNPAVRYVASGVATALLTKLATKMSERYPEISRFLTENLDSVEGKLAEFKNGLSNDTVARH